jgi:membrane peptidoglycan carboxypeptidase
VVITNRRDGGVVFWLARLYGFAAFVILAGAVLTTLIVYSYFSLNAPAVPDLRAYAQVTPAVSRVYAADGTKLGEFAKEWREIVPFERMPKRLVDAFLAVEDHDFYHHGGLYWKGIGPRSGPTSRPATSRRAARPSRSRSRSSSSAARSRCRARARKRSWRAGSRLAIPSTRSCRST